MLSLGVISVSIVKRLEKINPIYNDYKTKVVSSMELKPLIDAEQESELLTENSVNANPIAVNN